MTDKKPFKVLPMFSTGEKCTVEDGRDLCPKCRSPRLNFRGFTDAKFTAGYLLTCEDCGTYCYVTNPRDFEDYCMWDDDPTVEKYNEYMKEHYPEMVVKEQE